LVLGRKKSKLAWLIKNEMKKNTDTTFYALENQDWELISSKLLKYTKAKINQIHWYTGHGEAPKGIQAEDIVQEAIYKVLNGERRWNPQQYPDLLTFLKSIIRSEISHLLKSWDHQHVISTEKIEMKMDKENLAETPEEILINAERKKHLHQYKEKLFELAKDDEEVFFILDCYENDIWKPREIANKLGVQTDKVYNALKRLKRMLKKIEESEGRDE